MRRCRRGGVTGEYRQLVGRLARHCRFTLVLRAQCLVVADGGADRLATTDRVQPQPAHQPLNPATRYCLSFTFHLLPDLVGPVDLKLVCQTALIFGINTPSRRALALSNEASRHRATCRRYVDGESAGHCRSARPRTGHAAPQLAHIASVGGRAPPGLGTLKIPLVRRDSLFPRPSSFIRCFSAVLVPLRKPLSISCRSTQLSSVCGTQEIFGAIDSAVAHSDAWSPRCCCAIRTARIRTSGDNKFDLFAARSSKELEPYQNPGG